MYLKLGRSQVVNTTGDVKSIKYNLLAAVVDSPISYETPVIVNDRSELDIWFSRSMVDYEFYSELLLNSDVSLLLYKPVSPVERTDLKDYISLKEIFGSSIDNWDTLLENVETFKNGNQVDWPVTVSEEILEKLSGPLLKLELDDIIYVWSENDKEFVDIEGLVPSYEIPESLEKHSTLSILTDNEWGLNYYYPTATTFGTDSTSGAWMNLDADKIFKNHTQTLSVSVTYEEGITSFNGYLCLKVGDVLYFAKSSNNNTEPPNNSINLFTDYTGDAKGFVTEFLGKLKNENSSLDIINDKIVCKDGSAIDLNGSLGIGGVSINADKISNVCSILNKRIRAYEDLWDSPINMEFWSKTIGVLDQAEIDNGGDIKIKIEDLGSHYFRFTISRYDYEEIIEGEAFPEPGSGELPLDKKITRDSKLVYCVFRNTRSGLKTGEYTLRSFFDPDECTYSYWKNSLDKIFSDYGTYIDYFLVRNVNKYTKSTFPTEDVNYYDIYLKFLEYSKLYHTQFLIQNGMLGYDLVEIPNRDVLDTLEPGYYYIQCPSTDSLSSELTLDGKVSPILNVGKLENQRKYGLYVAGDDIVGDRVIIGEAVTTDLKLEIITETPEQGLGTAIVIINNSSVRQQLEISSNKKSFDLGAGSRVLLFYRNGDWEFNANIDSKIVYKKIGDTSKRVTNRKEADLIFNGGNFIFNYTYDSDNRLIYFNGALKKLGNYYPGYYLYLRGILENNFKFSEVDITYDNVLISDYVQTNYEKLLESKKSNYLVFNNHLYYYNKFFNGSNYNTTGYLRFIIGKISRELEKWKGSFLGLTNYSEAVNIIQGILDGIKTHFNGIVKYITINKSELLPEKSSINLEISTGVYEFVDSDITLNIIINK